jgi:hypothetical protein
MRLPCSTRRPLAWPSSSSITRAGMSASCSQVAAVAVSLRTCSRWCWEWRNWCSVLPPEEHLKRNGGVPGSRNFSAAGSPMVCGREQSTGCDAFAAPSCSAAARDSPTSTGAIGGDRLAADLAQRMTSGQIRLGRTARGSPPPIGLAIRALHRWRPFGDVAVRSSAAAARLARRLGVSPGRRQGTRRSTRQPPAWSATCSSSRTGRAVSTDRMAARAMAGTARASWPLGFGPAPVRTQSAAYHLLRHLGQLTTIAPALRTPSRCGSIDLDHW